MLGLKVTTTDDVIVNAITQGTISMSVLETAETKNVSLIIVGARGINPIQELLLGSVSSSVVRYAKTNVLVMHAGPEHAAADLSTGPSHRQLFSKVLVPTDFSQSASDAFSLIKSIPGIKEIVLLHVVNHADSQPEIKDCVNEAQLRFEDMKKEFAGKDVVVTQHIRVGDPTEMILSVAKEDNVSLIAMSAYGTGWLREMLLGSTTFTVVRRAKKPVLVLRPGQKT